jgi:hypothetical protein
MLISDDRQHRQNLIVVASPAIISSPTLRILKACPSLFMFLDALLTDYFPTEGSVDYCCPRCCPRPPDRSRCCDICTPALAAFLSVMEDFSQPPRNPTQSRIAGNDTDTWMDSDFGLQEALEIWREQAAEARWGPNHMIGGIGILSDDQIERIIGLARRRLISTPMDFQRELKWHYHSQHGIEALAVIHSSHPPQDTTIVTSSSANLSSASLSNVQAPPKSIRIMKCSICREPGHNSECCLQKLNHCANNCLENKCLTQGDGKHEKEPKASTSRATTPLTNDNLHRATSAAIPRPSPLYSHGARHSTPNGAPAAAASFYPHPSYPSHYYPAPPAHYYNNYPYYNASPYYNPHPASYSSTAISPALNPLPPPTTSSAIPSAPTPSGSNHNSPNELAPAAAPAAMTLTGTWGSARPA